MIGLMKIYTPKFPFRRNTLHVFHDFPTIYNVFHDFYPQCVLNGEIFSFLYVVCSTSFDSLVEKLSLVCGEIYPSVSRPLDISVDFKSHYVKMNNRSATMETFFDIQRPDTPLG